jgi:DNA modification methylase
LKTESIALSKLRPYVRNPRVNDDVIEKLVDSLGAFGWRQPIVVDKQFTIVVGHARFEAAKRLGWKTAPVHVAKDLTAAQLKAYRLMDNRSREDGRWDPENLALELGDLEADGQPLSATGFEDAELREIFGTEMFVGRTEDNEVEALAEPPAVRSQLGDMFILGPHRVVCGDCRIQDTLARLMKRKPADMCFTDPPYNVAYVGNVIGAERKAIANDKMSDMGFRDLLRRAFASIAGCMKPGASIYVAHAETERLNVQRAFCGAGFKLSSCLIWKKDSFVIGRSDYHWQHESILYGWKDGASHSWKGTRSESTILEFPRPARSEEHPTMKPVDLVAQLIRNSSAEGGVVLDAFGGAGSTLIACHKEARAARLVELEPLYVDVIVRRWQAYTGESAKREGDGTLFDELPLVPVTA